MRDFSAGSGAGCCTAGSSTAPWTPDRRCRIHPQELFFSKRNNSNNEFESKTLLLLGAILVCVGGSWYVFLGEQDLLLWTCLVPGAICSFKNLPLDLVIKIMEE